MATSSQGYSEYKDIMSNPNANWTRWILASISKHIDARKEGLNLFIEGQHRKTEGETSYLELRYQGPNLAEVSKGYWQVNVSVNMLIVTIMDDENWHDHVTNVGIAQAAFTTIFVYKYGSKAGDDSSLLGCLKLVDAGREPIETSNFGQIDPNVKVQETTVEGHYELELSV